VILLKHTQSLTGSDMYSSFIGFYFTTQYFHKGTFAGAIGTYDTIAVTFGKIDTDFVK
jgi:hypothetical protein